MTRSVLLFVLALFVTLCGSVSVRSQMLSKGTDSSRAVRRSESANRDASAIQLGADVLLSKKKKKKHAAADDGADAPAADGAPVDTGAKASSAAQGAATGGSSSQTNSTSAASPSDSIWKQINDKIFNDKKAEEEKKKLEDAKPKVTPCPGPGVPCNQLYMGAIMPGELQMDGSWTPGQRVNGQFVKGQTINGIFYATPKTGPDPRVEEAKKKAEEAQKKAEREEKERIAKLDREDKLRKEAFENELKLLKEKEEKEEREAKRHQEERDKEDKERKKEREKEEEEYLRKKEAREAEERREARQKKLEEMHQEELKAQHEREEAIEKKEEAMREKIEQLQKQNKLEQQKIKDELMKHTQEQITKALNAKAAAHILGENSEKQGFVEGAQEGILDTKKAMEFQDDVKAAVEKEVKEAMARAFARGQIKELAKERAKLEAAKKIDEAYAAGRNAAIAKIAREEAEKKAENQLIDAARNPGQVTLPDGKVLAAVPPTPSWAYTGPHGPEHWPGVCETGFVQSPLNIYGVAKSDAAGETPLKPLVFTYEPTAVNLEFKNHTIRLNYDRGSYFTANGVTYDLEHIEFHTPSEHMVRGLHFPLEVQLHHKGRENPANKAVVVLLSTEGPRSAGLELFWEALPTISGDVASVEGVNFNIADLLPLSRGYFSYEGSLTRPPCTEGVQYYVLSHYMSASPLQIKKLLDITGENNRPVQVPNTRVIRQYNPEDNEAKLIAAEQARELGIKKGHQ